jgi:hypothetical protein
MTLAHAIRLAALVRVSLSLDVATACYDRRRVARARGRRLLHH